MSVPSWNISRPLQHVSNVDFSTVVCSRCAPGIVGGGHNANLGLKKFYGALRRSLCPQLQNLVSAYVRQWSVSDIVNNASLQFGPRINRHCIQRSTSLNQPQFRIMPKVLR